MSNSPEMAQLVAGITAEEVNMKSKGDLLLQHNSKDTCNMVKEKMLEVSSDDG